MIKMKMHGNLWIYDVLLHVFVHKALDKTKYGRMSSCLAHAQLIVSHTRGGRYENHLPIGYNLSTEYYFDRFDFILCVYSCIS